MALDILGHPIHYNQNTLTWLKFYDIFPKNTGFFGKGKNSKSPSESHATLLSNILVNKKHIKLK